ncbi:MAG: AAA family ATPase [Eubacteriales bacterium]|nr:AAA family ATPase [Eubacteriales bacterium]
MAIKTIDILNVLIFQRQWRKNNGDCKRGEIQSGDKISDVFHLDFCDGINVIIGENGVGKTSLLKMIYAATQWSIKQTNQGKTKRLQQFFSNSISGDEVLKNSDSKEGYCYFRVSDGKHKFEYSLSHQGIFNSKEWFGLNIQSVFIPTTEMLSHSEGFLALYEKYNMPFDGTQVDIIVNASLPETREIPQNMRGILEKISAVIDGEVILENDNFFVLKKDGRKVDFSLEAEGLRKLGLLWKLIRNGLLEKGTILLWDEPEANLNPELYPLVVDILVELQKNGVQMFIATHSYNFAKYLEIRREKREDVLFHNLYRATSEMPEILKDGFHDENQHSDEIYSQTAYKMDELEPNYILQADSKLLDAVYQQSMKEIEQRIAARNENNG